jgi:hypothetical protein
MALGTLSLAFRVASSNSLGKLGPRTGSGVVDPDDLVHAHGRIGSGKLGSCR